MKRIETIEDKRKRENRNKIVIGIILVGIMIVSTAGYAFFSNPREESIKKVEESGYKFELGEDGFWHIIKENYEFAFTYLPSETKNISVPIISSLQIYIGKPLYLSSNNPVFDDEIAKNIGRFTKRIQRACIPEINCTIDLPIKNCSIDNIIVHEEKQDIKIKNQENCIFIEAPYTEAVRASDAFIYKLIGIRN